MVKGKQLAVHDDYEPGQRRLILGPGAVGLPKSKIWFPVTELAIEGEVN